MQFSSSSRHEPSSGLTLIELLVVVFILMIFVASAAPLINPDNSDRRIREASRQLNAYVAEAKAHAAQRNRPVGIAFDRATAIREGSRDANLISRLYLVEVPPTYTGDDLSSTVRYWCNPNDQTATQYRPASITVGGVPRPPIKIKLRFERCFMLDAIVASYVPTGTTSLTLPLGLRVGGEKLNRSAVVVYDNSSATPSFTYAMWIQYGDPLYERCSRVVSGNVQVRQYPVSSSVPTPLPPRADTDNQEHYEESLALSFPPLITGDTPLDLPTGTVVDLQFSGYAAAGSEFFDSSRNRQNPLVILFSPGGNVTAVQDDGWSTPTGRIHLLVGSARNAAESLAVNNPNERRLLISNLTDATSSWVSISTQTGQVLTNDLSPLISGTHVNPATPVYASGDAAIGTAVRYARELATSLQPTGGR
jgi:type II secretory pathway pseudopilin PulG